MHVELSRESPHRLTSVVFLLCHRKLVSFQIIAQPWTTLTLYALIPCGENVIRFCVGVCQ